jgi:ketosteroid isomerase-like protein
MTTDVERFLQRFAAFGAKPAVETYLALFHPDATLFDSGMQRPITVPEIPEHIEGILKLVPDFEMTPERWRFRGGTLFVEARNEASLGEKRLRWRSVYCVDLRGSFVIRGRRYYDRQPLYSLVAPNLPSLPPFHVSLQSTPPLVADAPQNVEAFVESYSGCWRWRAPQELQQLYREDGCMWSPGLERPLARAELPSYYESLLRLIPDLVLELETWAGDEDLVFLEWRARGTVGGRALQFGLADRLDLGAGLILNGRAYFDTLALLVG